MPIKIKQYQSKSTGEVFSDTLHGAVRIIFI